MSKNEEAGTVALVDRILSRGVADRASDIHIEPRPGEVRVRFRIDGILVERPSFPVSYRQSASRLGLWLVSMLLETASSMGRFDCASMTSSTSGFLHFRRSMGKSCLATPAPGAQPTWT